MINTCMKISDIVKGNISVSALCETPVDSSWIMKLSQKDGNVLMALNGRRYLIQNVPSSVYDSWIKAQSKGKFWHQRIKGVYRVERLK